MEKWRYQDFLVYMKRNWRLGEHIGIIAPTGGGKSYITKDLVPLHKRSVIIATKAKDKTLDAFPFVRRTTWPPEYNEYQILLWKKPKELGMFGEQQLLVYNTMNDIYKHGGWTVYFDDLYYIANTLGLKRAVQMFYTQVRSQNVSIVANMQRPRLVVLEAVSQATYLIILRVRDKLDVERIAEGMGIDRKELLAANEALAQYEFLLLENGKEPVHVEKAS